MRFPDANLLAAYRHRRDRIAARLGGGVLVLHGGELKVRANDTEFRFRPDSDFYYLTGIREPNAVLVLRPHGSPREVLFVRPNDPVAETWSGRRIGPHGATERFGIESAHTLAELPAKLPDLLDGADAIHLPIARYHELDEAVRKALFGLRRIERTGHEPPTTLCDSSQVLGEDRLVKDDLALACLRRATEISASAHLRAMQSTHPGAHEHEIEALLEYEFRRAGAWGPGYGSIVGAGDNATILHYVDNDGPLRDGELLLVDAGAEWEGFTADITRTYPIGGHFTPAQRELYEIVLAANMRGIATASVGSSIDAIHAECLRVLCRGLVDLGLLRGDVDGLIESEAYQRYYMHRTSHWLGADVHDVGRYCIDRKSRALEPGFVLTVEPALYVSADDEQAPAALRGCGIRIEDDVLITAAGPEVLTHGAPKTVAELEATVGSGPRIRGA